LKTKYKKLENFTFLFLTSGDVNLPKSLGLNYLFLILISNFDKRISGKKMLVKILDYFVP